MQLVAVYVTLCQQPNIVKISFHLHISSQSQEIPKYYFLLNETLVFHIAGYFYMTLC